MSKAKEGVPGNPKFDMRGGLWLQQKGQIEPYQQPLWRGEIQIDGTVYMLEGKRPKTDKARAPEIALTARIKEVY